MVEVAGELGNIRGAALDDFLAWYGRERDAHKLKRAVAALPEALQQSIRWNEGLPRLISFAWYPCELMHGLLDGLLDGLSDYERQRFAKETAEQVMESTLKGVYRAVFKAVGSPKMMARFGPRLWSLYYDTGVSVTTMESATSHFGTIRDWKGHHPFLCDVNRHSTDWMYRQLGCQQVICKQLECVSKGAKQCATHVTWV